MVPIKIVCGCGQRFAFDVEPVNGQMPSAIACPACGGDATSAANEIIGQTYIAPIIPVAARVPVVVTASPTPKPTAPVRRLPGQLEPAHAEAEAKAKILWGDSKEEVIQFLMMQGFSVNDASELVQVAFKERAVAVRAEGIRKVFIGLGMMFGSVISLPFARLSFWLLGMAGIAGLSGFWMALNGTLMALAPKSEKGDIHDK
ncbi:MAG TPA: hypothetical protein VGI03_08710 [Verrucomicrobiae bacterium]|jgi:hypothetical protein